MQKKMEQFRELLLEHYYDTGRKMHRHLGQNEYASDILGVSPATYSAWLQDDRRYPSNENLIILARTFGTKVFEIFGRPALFAVPDDPVRRALADELMNMPQEDAEHILSIVEGLRVKRLTPEESTP